MSSVTMALKRFHIQMKSYSTYEIPERYRNAFYLANAALYDQVNWYLHRAYEVCFPKLVSLLREREPKLTVAEASKMLKTTIRMLDQCNSIIDVRFPVRRENGDAEIVRGFRAQHGLYSGFGTCLGGLRIKEDLTRDHVKGLSAISTYKHSCMGIRLAGAHGGIKIAPSSYTAHDLQGVVKRYSAELYTKGFCNGQTDIIEPDINTGEREMRWIAEVFPESYDKVMVVGKPAEIGGIPNYYHMASQAIFFALDNILNNRKVLERVGFTQAGLNNKTFIIEGIGKLGAALALFLESSGAKCVGVKEADAHIYNPKGIKAQALIDHHRTYGDFLKFENAKPGTSTDIFKEECDILILAGQQKSLVCYMADKVRAKVVVEASNGAITPTSHRILMSRFKLVLPDIYVCSGYSVASYLEYLLNFKENVALLRPLYRQFLNCFTLPQRTKQVVSVATTQKIINCDMKPDLLTYAIEHVMRQTGDELIEIANEYSLGLDLRIAGYVKAILSIHDSIYCNQK